MLFSWVCLAASRVPPTNDHVMKLLSRSFGRYSGGSLVSMIPFSWPAYPGGIMLGMLNFSLMMTIWASSLSAVNLPRNETML